MPRKPRPKMERLVHEIGKNLARVRQDRGIKQIELAKKLNVSQSNVSSYERGLLRIPADLLACIAKLLQVSADELLGVIPPSSPQPASGGRRLRRRLELLEGLGKRDQDTLNRLL